MTVTRVLCVVFGVCLPLALLDIGGRAAEILLLVSGVGALAIGAWRLDE